MLAALVLRASLGDTANPDAVVINGSLAGATEWAAGRGDSGVSVATGEVPAAPAWI